MTDFFHNQMPSNFSPEQGSAPLGTRKSQLSAAEEIKLKILDNEDLATKEDLLKLIEEGLRAVKRKREEHSSTNDLH